MIIVPKPSMRRLLELNWDSSYEDHYAVLESVGIGEDWFNVWVSFSDSGSGHSSLLDDMWQALNELRWSHQYEISL